MYVYSGRNPEYTENIPEKSSDNQQIIQLEVNLHSKDKNDFENCEVVTQEEDISKISDAEDNFLIEDPIKI